MKIQPWFYLFCGLLMCAWQSAYAATESRIVTVDIPYDLFNALVEYQELHEDESQQRPVDPEQMVNVLQILVAEFERELERFHGFAAALNAPPELATRLDKMQQHIDDFHHELKYYRTILEYQQLVEKQRQMINAE